ncbi:MAG: isocitrate/isopropylmalate dehydrogenase family protein [Pseudonocardiaceae bacterium]|nr:isocitrate/isopropylmalate dehydrogenase family protein [Pseudonocardiaceae bacterium]
MQSSYRIALIPGDGIGPELIDSAVTVLSAAARAHDLNVRTDREPGGAGSYLEIGHALPPGTLDRLRTEYDAVLKGPVGLPGVRHQDGTEAGLLGGVLRGGLDTFANVRPIRLLPGVDAAVRFSPGEIDYVIVRENTEGLYLSRGAGVANRWAASDQLMVTREGCERVIRFAFETARTRGGAPADGVRRVTCVDKSNVLRSFAFFRGVFDEIATEYPDVAADHRYSDAAAHDLVAAPGGFDVLVTENFLGDLLSDLGAGTVGGLGMCGSANIGADAAYFEPIHGSAPDIAGQDRANPTSQILAAAMLLDHLGELGAGNAVRDAVHAAYAAGVIRLNPAGQPEAGTAAATRAITAHL